jgi:hypothetical protein
MTLTEDDAAKLVRSTLELIRSSEGRELLDGIDESRRLGIEEKLPEQKGSDMKQVGRIRKRPPTDLEMLQIIFEQLYQRLVILPKVAMAIKGRLGGQNVIWRVDTEFVSVDRFPEAQLSSLAPEGTENISSLFEEIIRLIPIVQLQHKHGNSTRT